MTNADEPAWSAIVGPESSCSRRPPGYVRKQLVHNTHVIADLEARGAVFVDELDIAHVASTYVRHRTSPAYGALQP